MCLDGEAQESAVKLLHIRRLLALEGVRVAQEVVTPPHRPPCSRHTALTPLLPETLRLSHQGQFQIGSNQLLEFDLIVDCNLQPIGIDIIFQHRCVNFQKKKFS